MNEKDIISALLKSVYEQGLISEETYRNSLKSLEIHSRTSYSKLQRREEFWEGQ